MERKSYLDFLDYSAGLTRRLAGAACKAFRITRRQKRLKFVRFHAFCSGGIRGPKPECAA
jgi:hypothetical protein